MRVPKGRGRPARKADDSRAARSERWQQIRRPLLLATLLAGATLAVYAQVWDFSFIAVDDPLYVTDNGRVPQGITLANLKWLLTAHAEGNWIPLTWLSYLIDAQIYGLNPGGYHVTNVLFHVANTVLLFVALVRATGSDLRSAFVAALFALHPLHVESVAWVAERKDVLSTFFVMLSLLAYVNYGRSGRLGGLIASFVLFVLSLMSKQTLVTLPFVYLLLDYWPLGRIRTADGLGSTGAKPSLPANRRKPRVGNALAEAMLPGVTRLVLEKLPFFAAAIVFSLLVFVTQQSGKTVASLTKLPLSTRCLNAVVVYATYIWQTLVPQNLVIFYPHPGNALPWTAVGVAALVLVAISAAACIYIRRFPYLFVGWCWYLGTLVPVIGIVQIGRQQMADRYTYFPLIGLFLAVTWLVPEFAKEGALLKRALPAVATAILALLTVTTFAQVSCWRDNVTIFRHALDSARDSAFAKKSLGYVLTLQGDPAEGLPLLESAVAMEPLDAEGHYDLAVGLEKVGRVDTAMAEYRKAIALYDGYADAQNNLGVLLSQRKDYAEAKQHFLQALQAKPDHLRANVNLGALCIETGDYDQAITYSRRALAIDPRLVNCERNIAIALRGQGKLDEAIRQFEYLLTISPDDADLRQELARTRAMKRGDS